MLAVMPVKPGLRSYGDLHWIILIMKFLILSKDMNFSVTGGQKVNKRIYDILSHKGHEVTFCQQLHPTNGNWQYLISLIIHVSEYLKYDKIIIDSSSFPKTLWFVLIAGLFGKREKITTTLHHYIYESVGGIKGIVYKLLETTFVKQCGTVIIFSPYIIDLSKELIPISRIRYVGLPFEKGVHFNKNKKNGQLLFVGTIDERKGLKYLVEAIALMPADVRCNVVLNVVGKVVSESYYNDICTMIKNNDIEKNIVFKGRVSDEELKNLFDESMIFTFPSLLEGFGMVIIEAMAKGLPVVAFDNSAMPYTIKTGVNGIITKNKNAQSLCDAIVEILSDHDYYVRLAEGARKTYEQSKSYEEFDSDIITLFS